MKIRTIPCLCILALALFLAFPPASAHAADVSREVQVSVDPGLLNDGVRATVAAVPPPSAQDAAAPVALLFVTFEKPFHGDLYVRGFRKDGQEIARSATVPASEPAEAGGHIRFPFDKDTNLATVTSFILEGGATPVADKPKKESFGEATENIVKELLQ